MQLGNSPGVCPVQVPCHPCTPSDFVYPFYSSQSRKGGVEVRRTWLFKINDKGFFSTNCTHEGTFCEKQPLHTCSYFAQIIQKLHDYSWCSNEPNLRALLRGSWEAGYAYSGSRNYDFWLPHLAGWAACCLHRLKYMGTSCKRASLSTNGTTELKRSLKNNRGVCFRV